jgi:hypothetical protein
MAASTAAATFANSAIGTKEPSQESRSFQTSPQQGSQAVKPITGTVGLKEKSGYVTIRIYLDGPPKGDIGDLEELGFEDFVQIDGSVKIPNKVCGIKWKNPVEWYWAVGGGNNTPVKVLHNGEPGAELSFTGPYLGCGNEPYNFVTPATPSGNPPDGSTLLIVQAYPEDIEWLDSHMNPIPPALEPPPEPGDICDKVPEFCEPHITNLCKPYSQGGPVFCNPVKPSHENNGQNRRNRPSPADRR